MIVYQIFMGETVGTFISRRDGEILDAWRIMRETNLRCTVHAEDKQHHPLPFATSSRRMAARTRLRITSRDPRTEAECIHRAIRLRRKPRARSDLPHVVQGMGRARAARQGRGVDVKAETGPHYHHSRDHDMVRMGLGSLMKITHRYGGR